MSSKLMLFVIILPLVIASVSAQSLLDISPSSLSITTNTTTIVTRNLNITNNHDFKLFNINFQDFPEIIVSNISELEPGATAILPIKVSSTEATTKTINSIVSYDYLIDVGNNPQTYEVNITNKFTPNSLKIRTQDTINFNNKDLNQAHNIKNTNLGIDEIISSNSSYSHIFSSTGNFTIIDIFGFAMNIEVTPNIGQELTHNPDFDQVFTINLNTLYSETDILMELIDQSSFTLDNNQETDGVLRITNNGNEIAKTIKLTSSKWVTFNQNDFDVGKGSSKIVTYTIKPQATIRNETNTNHQISITALGINTNEETKNIDVFVNLDETLPEEDFANLEFDELLQKLLELVDRIRILNESSANVTVGNLTVELNRDSVLEALRGTIELKDLFKQGQQRDENTFLLATENKERLGRMESSFSNFTNSTSNSMIVLKDQQEATIYGISAILFLFALLIIGAVLRIKRNSLGRNREFIGYRRKKA